MPSPSLHPAGGEAAGWEAMVASGDGGGGARTLPSVRSDGRGGRHTSVMAAAATVTSHAATASVVKDAGGMGGEVVF